MSEYILVFDSGGGGKFVLSELKKVLPQENFLLFCDEFNCPYGNKSLSTLKKIVLTNLKKLLENYQIKIVVIACNTIGSMFKKEIKTLVKTHFNSTISEESMVNYAKKNLKRENIVKNKLKNEKSANKSERYKKDCPVLFVEPQINKTILRKPTLVLGTSNTVKHNKKVQIYKTNPHLFAQGFGSLASKIDHANGDFSCIKATVNRQLSKFKNKNIKNVVLACTHYNLIKEEIKNVVGQDVKFFENSRSVALKTRKIVLKQCKNTSKTQKKSLKTFEKGSKSHQKAPKMRQNDTIFLNKIL